MKQKKYSWSDISINAASDIQDVCAMKWHNDERDLSKLVELASIITRRPIEDFEKMKLTEWSVVKDDILSFLSTDIPKDVCTDRGIWQEPYYNLNGTRYMVTTSRNKMTAAQYIDYTTYMAESKDDLVSLMSTILIPEGRDYGKGYDMERVKKDIGDHLPITRALGLGFFFTISSRSYAEAILHYLLKTARRELRKIKMMRGLTDEMIEQRNNLEVKIAEFGRILQTVSLRRSV